MAQISYRANLISQHMPFAAQLQGQTVIVPGKDQAFSSNVITTAADDEKDKGLPQIYYADNVMPTGEGIQSVGYTTRLLGLPGVMNFQGIFVLRDIDENKVLFSPSANQNYTYDATIGFWKPNPTIPDIGSNKLVTVAYIAGVTYVFFQGVGMYTYDTTTKLLTPVPLTGLIASTINGITESSGFLLAWNDFTIYRSNPNDLTNFTPDVSVGAGSSIPEDLNGKIVVCYPTIGGFIIYCTKNAVGASFSQNLQFPFNYKEIRGSSGITDPGHVAWNHNNVDHYAWTLAGLQKVNRVEATLVFAQLTDFLTSKIFEDFNTITNQFDTTKLTGSLKIRLSFIANRWLAISYGIDSYTNVWVHDLAFKRFGRLKRNHVAVFELYLPNFYEAVTWDSLGTLSWDDLGTTTWADLLSGLATTEAPKEIFALLLEDGTVEIVNFDSTHTNDSGIVILGKYQYVRERWISIQDISIENVDTDYNFVLKLLSTWDGKNISQVTIPFLYNQSGLLREYKNPGIQGKNQSLLLEGTFHVQCADLNIKIEGRNR